MKAIFYEGELQNNYVGHIMSEIYKEKVYDPYLVGKKDLTILDIGANIGLTAQYFANYGKVYSVEPANEHFTCLFEMIKYNKLEDKITPINKALYINNDKLPFYHNTNRTMYSLHQAVHDGSSSPEEVSCISLDKLFEQYKIEHVDLMKLDVEGSEVEILSSEGFRLVADRINTIIIERHAWSGRNPNQLTEVLKMRGFSIEKAETEADIIIARR